LNKKKISIICATLILTSITILAVGPSMVQAIYMQEQGTDGGYIRWGPRRLACGYSAISVAIGTGVDTIITTGKGGLVDLVGDSLALKLGFATALFSSYAGSTGLISIKLNVAIYDYNTGSYVYPNSRIFVGSNPVYDTDNNGISGTTCDVIYRAASFVLGKLNPYGAVVLAVLGYVKTPGGITSSYINSAKTATWRAEGGPIYYIDYDHQEIYWDGFLSNLDDSNDHCYKVNIRADICHTGNIDYVIDSIYYYFYLNKMPYDGDGGGGGGGGSNPPIISID